MRSLESRRVGLMRLGREIHKRTTSVRISKPEKDSVEAALLLREMAGWKSHLDGLARSLVQDARNNTAQFERDRFGANPHGAKHRYKSGEHNIDRLDGEIRKIRGLLRKLDIALFAPDTLEKIILEATADIIERSIKDVEDVKTAKPQKHEGGPVFRESIQPQAIPGHQPTFSVSPVDSVTLLAMAIAALMVKLRK